MEFMHKPVLLKECIEHLEVKPDAIYVDGTVGGAGHSVEILKRLGKNGILIGIDQDPFAIKTSQERLSRMGGEARFILERGNFKKIKSLCLKNGISAVNGILLDLGVSSHQLDEADRGFSYQKDAPLDMRMDTSLRFTAETIVNEYPENQIKEIIQNYGEEKWAGRIAAFIVKARKENRIKTTMQLVDIIKAAIPSAARREGPHPAKRTFQALRIAVNDELGILKQAIDDSVSLLKSGGKLCIITFHSLEDRIVKNEFARKTHPCTCPKNFPICVCGKKPEAENVTKKPIIPSAKEVEENPRSRSAKLRVLKKI
ncbi:MAG: 16S rRNA (cytosine(1402)-N(4))-methyltransferase RsmH [Clostridiales bacterium]|jgi:16S rRNA (cytosine1402-N4)-methyltransferase|nr:16S rRNA (cytosine(1402)-N(4))-methyltransferase RsmH [Eubacteriales bacterium]MDH7564929.1 16S rRNA (cytosine(1402)-N(4))-methyltransferase RsmH [Clostridiales bacterium]